MRIGVFCNVLDVRWLEWAMGKEADLAMAPKRWRVHASNVAQIVNAMMVPVDGWSEGHKDTLIVCSVFLLWENQGMSPGTSPFRVLLYGHIIHVYISCCFRGRFVVCLMKMYVPAVYSIFVPLTLVLAEGFMKWHFWFLVFTAEGLYDTKNEVVEVHTLSWKFFVWYRKSGHKVANRYLDAVVFP